LRQPPRPLVRRRCSGVTHVRSPPNVLASESRAERGQLTPKRGVPTILASESRAERGQVTPKRWRGASSVALEDDAQPLEREPRLVVLDRAGVLDDRLRESAGRDHRALAQLGLEPIDQRVDLTAEPVDRPRLD